MAWTRSRGAFIGAFNSRSWKFVPTTAFFPSSKLVSIFISRFSLSLFLYAFTHICSSTIGMAMIMKRKRSDSELSFCNSSMRSSPHSNAMDIDMCMSPVYQESSPSHLHSRTRKRCRDNRPSESTIHRNTLSLLYSAQKQVHVEPIPSTAMDVDIVPPRDSSTRQTSLHKFFPGLSSQTSSTSSPPSPPPVNIRYQTKCEDCNSSLLITNEETGMDMDLDLGDTSADYGCAACNKQVCDHCSISILGAQRHCLNCAGKRQWTGRPGGLGVRNRMYLNHFDIQQADFNATG